VNVVVIESPSDPERPPSLGSEPACRTGGHREPQGDHEKTLGAAFGRNQTLIDCSILSWKLASSKSSFVLVPRPRGTQLLDRSCSEFVDGCPATRRSGAAEQTFHKSIGGEVDPLFTWSREIALQVFRAEESMLASKNPTAAPCAVEP
jgi:hypothetical protein